MAKTQTHLNRAIDKVLLAEVYASDGALLSSARCLTEAAEHMRKAGEQKQRDLEHFMSAPKGERVRS
jgi:hypothetical protein